MSALFNIYDDNGDDDDDDGVGYDDDDDDDESYSEDKEANSELQTKVITAIDNWPFPFILMVGDDDDTFWPNNLCTAFALQSVW